MSLPIPSFPDLLTAAKKNQLVVALVVFIIFSIWTANNWHDSSDGRTEDSKETAVSLKIQLVSEQAAHKRDNDKKDSIILSQQSEMKQVRLEQDAERKMLLKQLLEPAKKQHK